MQLVVVYCVFCVCFFFPPLITFIFSVSSKKILVFELKNNSVTFIVMYTFRSIPDNAAILFRAVVLFSEVSDTHYPNHVISPCMQPQTFAVGTEKTIA